ncbi:unnamed protein product, partial [Porites lobata]
MNRAMMIICLLLLLTEVDTWRRRRRRRAPPPCRAVNCVVSSWTGWSFCSHQCGTSGTQARTRQQTHATSCGGTCPYHLRETRACNRDRCQHGGTPQNYGCSCRAGYGGTCCGQACNRDSCQNGGTPHSSGCSCRTGYGGTCCGQGE